MSFLGMFIIFVIGLVLGTTLSFQLAELPSSFFLTLTILSSLGLLFINLKMMRLNSEAIHPDHDLDSEKQFSSAESNIASSLSRPMQNYTPNSSSKKWKITQFFLFNLNFLSGLMLGISLVFMQYGVVSSGNLSESESKQWFLVKVDSLVQIQENSNFSRITFTTDVLHKFAAKEKVVVNEKYLTGPSLLKVKLFWYLSHEQVKQLPNLPQSGETWLFQGKFKSNHASLNPAVRDYESWLLQQGVQGKITVSGFKKVPLLSELKQGWNAQQISPAKVWSHLHLRDSYVSFINQVIAESAFSGIYQALLAGDKSSIKNEQWQVFKTTGTIHLMAISGLHMSIVAMLAILISKYLWKLFVFRQPWLSQPIFSTLLAVLLCSIYLLLSGAAIPTQRAYIMVVTVLAFLLLSRQFQPFSALAMAALLVVLWDPSAVLNSGFWLSFMAVVIIFWGLQVSEQHNKSQRTIFIQFLLSLALMPLVAWHYYELPVFSLLANLIAVPFVSFIGLPLLLIAALVGMISIDFARELIKLSDELWAVLWDYLYWLTSLPLNQFFLPSFSILWLVLFYLGCYALIYFYRRQKVSHVGARVSLSRLSVFLTIFTLVIFVSIKYLSNPNTPRDGAAIVSVLDVGQGLAIVVQTKQHTFIYDTGPTWGQNTDAAQMVLLPFLKSIGRNEIDVLMVSHSDNDHAGGSKTILRNLKVDQQLSGQAPLMNRVLDGEFKHDMTVDSKWHTIPNFQKCVVGQEWELDGVFFEILAPNLEQLEGGIGNDNDHSCVLQISVGESRFLIMGDLSSQAEQSLLRRLQSKPGKLKSDILIAGHHGSRYSTSMEFLDKVQPRGVVFSSGYRNRFAFPSHEVLQRLSDYDSAIEWWNTACSGALVFEMNGEGVKLIEETRKSRRKWYHHRCNSSQQGILYQ